MASSSVSQEDVEQDFQLLSRRSKIRTARARNPLAFSQRPGDEMEAEDREESPKPGKTKDRRPAARTERPNFVNKGKMQRDRRKLREKRRSTGVVHLQSTESTGGSTGEDDEEQSPWDETKKNTLLNEGNLDKGDGKGCGRCYGPSDLEADDEDTQDGDSLNHLKLEVSLTELNIKDDAQLSHDSTPESPPTDLTEALHRAKHEMKQLHCQLEEARREISLLKAERDFLREQNLGLRNQALAAKK